MTKAFGQNILCLVLLSCPKHLDKLLPVVVFKSTFKHSDQTKMVEKLQFKIKRYFYCVNNKIYVLALLSLFPMQIISKLLDIIRL